jgi:Protein of unknown function (DUF2637)
MSTTMTRPAVPAPATAVPMPAALVAAADKWLSRMRTLLVAILGLAVGGIGALAFYTSFEAITAYARRSGGITPAHAWAIPLLVDSFIVVATGADLWFSTTKQQRRLWEVWWPKALLAAAAGVSFALNVAHVQAATWSARGVAAIPPAALVLGVELLMLVLRRATAIRAERLHAASKAPPMPARREREPRSGEPVPAGQLSSRPVPARRAIGARSRRAGSRLADDSGNGKTIGKDPGSGNANANAAGNGNGAELDADAQMRAHWLGERANGRTPSGAELDRHVGRDPANGAGRKARARYLREEAEGRLIVPAPAPEPPPSTAPVPAGPTSAVSVPGVPDPAVPAASAAPAAGAVPEPAHQPPAAPAEGLRLVGDRSTPTTTEPAIPPAGPAARPGLRTS